MNNTPSWVDHEPENDLKAQADEFGNGIFKFREEPGGSQIITGTGGTRGIPRKNAQDTLIRLPEEMNKLLAEQGTPKAMAVVALAEWAIKKLQEEGKSLVIVETKKD